MSTAIEGKAIPVTGANRDIGQALVTETLRRGAARVHARTRQPYAHPDPRVAALALGVADEGQVRAAAARSSHQRQSLAADQGLGQPRPKAGANR